MLVRIHHSTYRELKSPEAVQMPESNLDMKNELQPDVSSPDSKSKCTHVTSK